MITLVGAFPPPYGGISVHAQRLSQLLTEAFPEQPQRVLDFYGRKRQADDVGVVRPRAGGIGEALRAVALLRDRRARVVHFHVASMDNFLAYGPLLLGGVPAGTRKFLTVHSGGFIRSIERGGQARQARLARIVGRFDEVIAVNPAQREYLADHGLEAGRIQVIPAFLPPVMKASAEVERTMRALARPGRRLLLISGFAIRMYGFHTLVEAAQRLRHDGLDVGLVCCFYTKFDQAYLAELDALIPNDLPHALFRDLTPEAFSHLLSAIDVFVRATDADGDCVAIREAASFGKPVVASDCVARLPGVVTYKTFDAGAMTDALRHVFTHPTPTYEGFDVGAGREALLALYRRALYEVK